jgi:methylenetetrahydrofolate reductase (NADPH)
VTGSPPDAWGKPSLRSRFADPGHFTIAVELVTSRGLITEQRGQRVLRVARELAPHPRVDALSITDNPAGNAMLAADTMGTDLISRGQEVIIHLSCKDWNRNALQSRAWKLSSEGFHNVLALSGDYPTGGYRGVAAPIFDIDSVGLLRMYSDMNAGTVPDAPPAARTNFLLGAVVTNHKRHEREVMPQLFKLRKKVENGAAFIVNQIGYHARKDDELLKWMQLEGLGHIPVLANVFVLSPTVARVLNSGRVPGVVVTDELLELAVRHGGGPDKGRSFFLELAAQQMVVARGLGFRGAYIGGHLEAREYMDIIERADAYGPDDWRGLARELQFPLPDEFHVFERDEQTGLSSTVLAKRSRPRRPPLRYRVSRRVHDTVFDPDGALHEPVRKALTVVDAAPRRVGKVAHRVEQAAKVPMFECRDCGDCSLPDIAYLCPESQCVKNQRNGPCGGTRDGKCEVGEKDCIWALAYERLKPYGEETTMLDGPAVIKDNALRGTSAWVNTFLGRDHHAEGEVGR